MQRTALPFLILLSACRTASPTTITCDDPCYECKDPCLPCPSGQCVPAPPSGWEGPVLLWSGPTEEAPGCPQEAPEIVYEGHAGIVAEPRCPSCSCGPAVCVLRGMAAISTYMCQPGGVEIPYPAPEGWTGECHSNGVIPGEQVGSVQVLSPVLAPCAPIETPPEEPGSFGWETLARACKGPGIYGRCAEGLTCGTGAEPPEGFAACIYRQRQVFECPADYPEQRVFHDGIDASGVSCTACTCGDPEGGKCVVFGTAFEDTVCADLLGGSGSSLAHAGCTDSGAPKPLGSMTALVYENEPGTCPPSGGQPVGEAMPLHPTTFCCQPRSFERAKAVPGAPGDARREAE